ncbi:unnamed protein product [Phytophthora fragariaefolia]|uniref:Unnamed protein product n=1 Tax=Phytophthora fragariaefolia TaxID=1490495 RepID=A0A9W7CXB1_9STRA|nr:unnamed protein product [Phytophthora fragariaefolia]
MQFAAAFLFVLAVYEAAAEEACPPSEIVKFAELYANPHLHPCQKVSAGFSLAPPMGYPTEPQVKAMCAAEACRALVKDVLDLEPADCYLSFSDTKLNAYKLACSFRDACKAGKDEEHESKTHQPMKPANNKHTPNPKPSEGNKPTPSPKPTDEKYFSVPKHTDSKHYPDTEDDKHHPTPKPTDSKYYPTPKPTKDDKHYLTPTPKPSTNKHYPTPKPTDDDKHYPTPKPTDYEDHPTPKPTEGDKHYPTKPYHSTMKPTDGDKDHSKQEEPKIVTIEIEDKLSPTFRSIGKETAKEADAMKPPMNATALEMFPMPNTTYKATAEPKTAM